MQGYWGTLGPDAENRFVKTLPPYLAQVYTHLEPGKRLSIEDTTALISSMAPFVFPEGNESEQLNRLGGLMARLDMNGFYKLLLKIVSVQYAIQQATEFWHTYHDQGETYVEQVSKNHAHLLVFDYATMPMKYRVFLGGWVKGLLEHCGAKNLKVTLLPDPKPHVTYDIVWE